MIATHSERRREIELGNEPPLLSRKDLPDRRAVLVRWTAGTALLGAAACALFAGALLATFDERTRHAAAPVFVVPRYTRQAVAEGNRGDRDIRLVVAGLPAVRIEQLSDSGSMRPFTRVLARLADIDPEQRPDQGPRPTAASAKGAGEEPVGASELPPVILFGGSHRSRSGALPGAVSAYANEPSPRTMRPPLGQPLNVTVVPRSVASQDVLQHVVIARAGDTLRAILSGLAAESTDIEGIVSQFARRHWFRQDTFSGGETITIVEDASSLSSQPGHILKVTVESPDGVPLAIARTDEGGYQRVAAERLEVDSEGGAPTPGGLDAGGVFGETLRDSLHALARANKLDEAIVAESMRLCGHDFDLDRPLGPTDAADLLYAPDDLGQPELFFVALTAQGRTRRYYRFTAPDDGSTDFYDGQGRSITKFLLRKPVISGQLGDGFGWRIHPILHDRRFHEGVDYAAPYGSPVAAAGAGVVELIGQEWGYGKYIRIRHDLGYETTYAHVSGFPGGLKVGDRVRQAETIAYIGSTGLSTGPHLYYEVRINGHNVDPLQVKLSGGRALGGETLTKFLEAERSINELIAAPTHAAN